MFPLTLFDLAIAYYLVCAGIFLHYVWRAIIDESIVRKSEYVPKTVEHRQLKYWVCAVFKSTPFINLGMLAVYLYNRLVRL